MTLVGTAFRDATSAAESGIKYPPPGRSGSGDPWKPEPWINRAGNGRQTEELGSPERTPARTQQRIIAIVETSPKLGKRDTKLRYVGKSHVACLLIMFTDGVWRCLHDDMRM